MGLFDRLSKNSKCKKPNALTATLGAHLKNLDLVSVGPGDMHKDLLPIESVTVKLKDGTEVFLDKEEMGTVGQYGTSYGYAPFVEILRHLQMKHHNAPGNILSRGNDSWGVLPVAGALEGISKAFEMFLDEEDSYLLEVPSFPPIFDMLLPLSKRVICCNLNENFGLDPAEMRAEIEAAKAKGWPTPKLLYTCSTVSNPAGGTTTANRRREIYKLACEYDFYIIEDDPYYYLRFDDAIFKDMPSYLSLDTEGRVLRLDSFSKLVGGGFRIGYATGSAELIRQMTFHLGASTHHPSQLAQAVIAGMLNKWGDDGFLEYTRKLVEFQRRRMEIMMASADRHLSGKIEFKKPVGGLFLWFKVKEIDDTKSLVLRASRRGALFLSGSIFKPEWAPEDELQKNSFGSYVRASYSLVGEKQIDLAFQRFREALDEELIEQRGKQ